MALEQRYYKNKSDIKAFSVKTGIYDFKARGGNVWAQNNILVWRITLSYNEANSWTPLA